MTETEHAQWIRQFWLDKSDEMKSDLNEAVRIAYEQGRKDALEEVKAEIAEYKDDKVIHAEQNEMIDIMLEIIDKYKGE